MSNPDKYTFPGGAPDILDVTMTYAEFIDLLTDAWLEADMTEGPAPEMHRKATFYLFEKKIADKFEK